MKLTPNVGSRGLYSLKAPFVVGGATIFVCHAIRSFKDLYEKEVDVFTEFYEPYGLTRIDFENDKRVDAAIITLISEDESTVIYVPNTYILAIPNMDNVKYHRVVLSVDLGMLPEYVDIDFVKSELVATASGVVGVAPIVNTHVSKTTGEFTLNQHQVKEAARLSAISLKDTAHTRIMALTRQNVELQEKIRILQKIVIDNGLLD